MKIGGLFGYSDVGKTTLCESLGGQEVQKYRAEKKRGITLKVSYLQYTLKDLEVYILDNPGHLAMSTEALRNIDLLDFSMYVVDCEIIKNELKLKLVLAHYNMYVSIFKNFKIPFFIVFNKIDKCTKEQISKLYDLFENQSKEFSFIVPCCSLKKQSIDLVQQRLHRFLKEQPIKELKKYPGVAARVIKSFDVNSEGIYKDKFTGGVLGVYYYLDPKKFKEYYYLNDRKTKKWQKIRVVNFKYTEPIIGSIETSTDPLFYKNDLKKTCHLIDEDYLEQYSFLEKFEVRLKLKSTNIQKNQTLVLIHQGQIFNAIVKKNNKILQLSVVGSNYPLKFLKGDVIIFALKKDYNKTISFQGIGTIEN